MSESLDLVRSIYADWERGVFTPGMEWAHPDMEFVNPDGPEPGAWRGVAEVRRAFRDFLGAWHGFTIEVEEYRELPDGRVLVLVRHKGRGKTSGIDLGEVGGGANVLEIRDGEVSHLTAYWYRDNALADLGLEE